MAKGQPDFGQYAPTETIVGLSDLGELAARLGSIVTFDRRGNVIWMDDFENGIRQWCPFGIGTWSVDWESNYSKTGGFSCKLTTDAIAGRSVNIQKYIGFPILSAIGLEASFSNEQNWRYLEIWLWLDDGTYEYNAVIRYDHPNKKLQYMDATGAYQDIVGGSYETPDYPEWFDTLKFVADFTTCKYKRLLVNSKVFDLSALSFEKDPFATTPQMVVAFRLTTNANAAAIGYIDDVIITQNEP